MQQVVIGTAGHIDHGKTALVKALTGIDTDTLLQEKNRGITIDLGFAYLNEKVTIHQWIGVLLGFAGASLVLGIDVGSGIPMFGLVATIIALLSITFSLYFFIASK